MGGRQGGLSEYDTRADRKRQTYFSQNNNIFVSFLTDILQSVTSYHSALVRPTTVLHPLDTHISMLGDLLSGEDFIRYLQHCRWLVLPFRILVFQHSNADNYDRGIRGLPQFHCTNAGDNSSQRGTIDFLHMLAGSYSPIRGGISCFHYPFRAD